MDRHQSSIRSQISALVSIDQLKVWSLIVTVFGDLQKGNLRTLSGGQIRGLIEPMGIKPEAIRVALHRLRKDAWIETQKAGRETFYSLTKEAMAETVNVHDDIYRSGSKYSGDWYLQIAPFEQGAAHSGFELSPTVFLQSEKQLVRSENQITTQVALSELPHWVDQAIVSASSLSVAEQLRKCLASLVDVEQYASANELAILRILIVHHWRKLALRESTWFHIARYPDGALALCQKQVTGCLARFEPLCAELFVNS